MVDATPVTVPITIHLAANGVHVVPNSVAVNSDDTVVWDVADGEGIEAWTVAFKDANGPFKDFDTVRSSAGKPDGQVRAHARRPDTHYEYTIAVWDGTRIWLRDPEIIVDPDPTAREWR